MPDDPLGVVLVTVSVTVRVGAGLVVVGVVAELASVVSVAAVDVGV